MKKKKDKILVIHGPNLNLLGKRETSLYGKFTLRELNKELKKTAESRKISLETFQSNSEGRIVDKIASAEYDFLIINPAGYTHSSVAIRDAILARNVPAIEVHISNIFKREEFRRKSLVSDIAVGTITGLGKLSYLLALEAAINILK
ncbi:MAG: type II 3-dehydroquinate dehydratase [Candidatus Omnitrophica bacterium 4484_171]|nr:MAG: type II 3-dehydroquinate dehydratase [Candidatus Omnitrophica bacterium 4484_171]